MSSSGFSLFLYASKENEKWNEKKNSENDPKCKEEQPDLVWGDAERKRFYALCYSSPDDIKKYMGIVNTGNIKALKTFWSKLAWKNKKLDPSTYSKGLFPALRCLLRNEGSVQVRRGSAFATIRGHERNDYGPIYAELSSHFRNVFSVYCYDHVNYGFGCSDLDLNYKIADKANSFVDTFLVTGSYDHDFKDESQEDFTASIYQVVEPLNMPSSKLYRHANMCGSAMLGIWRGMGQLDDDEGRPYILYQDGNNDRVGVHLSSLHLNEEEVEEVRALLTQLGYKKVGNDMRLPKPVPFSYFLFIWPRRANVELFEDLAVDMLSNFGTSLTRRQTCSGSFSAKKGHDSVVIDSLDEFNFIASPEVQEVTFAEHKGFTDDNIEHICQLLRKCVNLKVVDVSPLSLKLSASIDTLFTAIPEKAWLVARSQPLLYDRDGRVKYLQKLFENNRLSRFVWMSSAMSDSVQDYSEELRVHVLGDSSNVQEVTRKSHSEFYHTDIE